jgi:hypothetical protein
MDVQPHASIKWLLQRERALFHCSLALVPPTQLSGCVILSLPPADLSRSPYWAGCPSAPARARGGSASLQCETARLLVQREFSRWLDVFECGVGPSVHCPACDWIAGRKCKTTDSASAISLVGLVNCPGLFRCQGCVANERRRSLLPRAVQKYPTRPSPCSRLRLPLHHCSTLRIVSSSPLRQILLLTLRGDPFCESANAACYTCSKITYGS